MDLQQVWNKLETEKLEYIRPYIHDNHCCHINAHQPLACLMDVQSILWQMPERIERTY